MALYSAVRPGRPITAREVRDVTAAVDPAEQLEAWRGVAQGSDRWHSLRSGRVTASNFGSVNHTNQFCAPADLLRNMLWPSHMDSVAMRYGSVNESRPDACACKHRGAPPSRPCGVSRSGWRSTASTPSGPHTLTNRAFGCAHRTLFSRQPRWSVVRDCRSSTHRRRRWGHVLPLPSIAHRGQDAEQASHPCSGRGFLPPVPPAQWARELHPDELLRPDYGQCIPHAQGCVS